MENNDTWTTNSGEVIKISEMSASHLSNITKFLDRQIENSILAYPCLQGEMAQVYAEKDCYNNDDIKQMMEIKKHIMQKELNRR